MRTPAGGVADAHAPLRRAAAAPSVVIMTGRYDQSDLNVYGAEDDEDMDAILDALDRANEVDNEPGQNEKSRS